METYFVSGLLNINLLKGTFCPDLQWPIWRGFKCSALLTLPACFITSSDILEDITKDSSLITAGSNSLPPTVNLQRSPGCARVSLQCVGPWTRLARGQCATLIRPNWTCLWIPARLLVWWGRNESYGEGGRWELADELGKGNREVWCSIFW